MYLAHEFFRINHFMFVFIGCADPPLLSNGVRVVSNDGFQANYTCNLGYSLKGLQTRHCLLATSEWEDVDPECGKNFNFYTFKSNGLAHPYELGQSISVLRVVGCYFSFLSKF